MQTELLRHVRSNAFSLVHSRHDLVCAVNCGTVLHLCRTRKHGTLHHGRGTLEFCRCKISCARSTISVPCCSNAELICFVRKTNSAYNSVAAADQYKTRRLVPGASVYVYVQVHVSVPNPFYPSFTYASVYVLMGGLSKHGGVGSINIMHVLHIFLSAISLLHLSHIPHSWSACRSSIIHFSVIRGCYYLFPSKLVPTRPSTLLLCILCSCPILIYISFTGYPLPNPFLSAFSKNDGTFNLCIRGRPTLLLLVFPKCVGGNTGIQDRLNG